MPETNTTASSSIPTTEKATNTDTTSTSQTAETKDEKVQHENVVSENSKENINQNETETATNKKENEEEEEEEEEEEDTESLREDFLSFLDYLYQKIEILQSENTAKFGFRLLLGQFVCIKTFFVNC
jgi:cation transport ATPase